MTKVIERIKAKEIERGKEKRNIPKLRFRRFEDNWVNYKFGNITKKTGIKNKEDKPYAVYSISNKYGFVPQNEQFEGSRLENLDKKSYKIVNNNEFSYNPARINVGSIGLLEEKKSVIVSSLYVCFKMNEYMNSVFFKVYFNTNIFNKNVLRNVEGGVRDYLFYENFSNIKVNVPSLQEQKKIADFFSLVDKKIEKQSEKVEALKTYQKGIMQKIFKQEIRFKDENGREYPEWEEKRLGDIGKTYTGLSGKTKEDFETGNAKYITYMNVFKNIKIKSELIDIVDIKDNENQNKVLEGDLLFTTSSETAEEVGMVSLCDKYIENLYLNSFCFGFRIKNLKINSNFIVYYLRSPKIRKKISILAQGSTRYNLSKNELMKLAIEIPCIEEQTQIATFLCTIDERMDKEEKKLEVLKVWKKGLLQKMFI